MPSLGVADPTRQAQLGGAGRRVVAVDRCLAISVALLTALLALGTSALGTRAVLGAQNPAANQQAANQQAANQQAANQSEPNGQARNPGEPPGDLEKAPPPETRQVYRIEVPLPLRGDVDDRVIRKIERQLTELGNPAERPIFVLEFRVSENSDGTRSRFEDALSLARFLAGEEMRRVRVIAYLPGQVLGHAVLPVVACEQIIVHPDAELGAAGLAERAIDPTMRRAYTDIAERRLTIPKEVVLSMLDPELRLTQAGLVGGGKRFVTDEQLQELRNAGQVTEEVTVSEPGDMTRLTGRALRLEYGFASHLARDTVELATALDIPPEMLTEGAEVADAWQAFRVDVRRRLTAAAVTDILQRIEAERLRNDELNLLVLWVDSPGGQPEDAMRLASYLADMDLHTVAYVGDQARSVAALVALACDEVYVKSDSLLGGPGEVYLDEQMLADLRPAIQQLAESQQRGWSLFAGLIDPGLDVHRYRQEGSTTQRYFSDEELAEQPQPQSWQREAAVQLSDGVTGAQAVELRLAKAEVQEFPEVLERYSVSPELEEARQKWLIDAIQRLAAQPWFARTLLFVAFFALISEASAPGLGLPGFIAAVSFLLFFWVQFLNGTAGWLEVLLFVGGLTFISLELFALPGFGVFGIGGILMLIFSLVLASQTFVIPRNAYQLHEVPGSLWAIAASGGGMFVALWFMRRFLARAPVLNRLMLSPPDEDEIEDLRRRESFVAYDYLMGKVGVATTRLAPAGKAQFGDDIVNVITEGDMVSAGGRVAVSEVLGNRIVVRPLDDV